MKLFLIGLALLATVYGEYVSQYDVPQDSLAVLEEIETLNEPSNLLDNGYRYKTVRRFRARHRRDVSELVSPDYLPPLDSAVQYGAPIESIGPVAEIPSGILADDGYRYKTVRKLRHRRRRDVTELVSPEYLPPLNSALEYGAPIESIGPVAEIPSGILADDGYRYKTVRKLRHRRRRDVSELVSPEYLPPLNSALEYGAPIESIGPVAEIPSGILADDGYRYKTVRKLRHRRRRDVSELVSPDYLPPGQEVSYQLPSNEYLSPIAPLGLEPQIASGVLADDGYRYRTVRKLRHRQRRDVNELTQYLPPGQEVSYEIPSNEYLAPIAPIAPEVQIASGVLADDGYRYKTVRKLRHRQRRDVSELASAQYLPPIQEIIPQTPVASLAPIADIPLINNDYLAPLQQIETILADDGYRYKTVKRFKIRRH